MGRRSAEGCVERCQRSSQVLRLKVSVSLGHDGRRVPQHMLDLVERNPSLDHPGRGRVAKKEAPSIPTCFMIFKVVLVSRGHDEDDIPL